MPTRYFYPRPLRGGRPFVQGLCLSSSSFLSTPSARRATVVVDKRLAGHAISIHALCEEGDSTFIKACHIGVDFYPRPLRGGRPAWSWWPRRTARFLSTPSARRATRKVAAEVAAQQDFYPRPLRGGRRSNEKQNQMIRRFLSTPSARRATPTPRALPGKVEFLSTPSARRATGVSRPLTSDDLFLSTPSARRATPYRAAGVQGFIISIHALCEEGDTPLRCTRWHS